PRAGRAPGPPVGGLGVRLFTDEMIDPDLARALRQRGYDAESCQEAGRGNQQIPDDQQLAYATQQQRAILTFNVGDFYRIDADWQAAGHDHYGILVTTEITDLGSLLRSVQQHLDHCTPAQQYNTILWLGSVKAP